MTVLILGGTGFIGARVALRLRARGAEVAVLHRGKTAADLPDGIRSVVADRRDVDALRREVAKLQPAVVVDVIAFSERDAEILLGALRGLTERVVVLSSADVYRAYGRLRRMEPGPPEPVPLTEDSPLRERLYPYRTRGSETDEDFDPDPDEYDKIPVERMVLRESEPAGAVVRLPWCTDPATASTAFSSGSGGSATGEPRFRSRRAGLAGALRTDTSRTSRRRSP